MSNFSTFNPEWEKVKYRFNISINLYNNHGNFERFLELLDTLTRETKKHLNQIFEGISFFLFITIDCENQIGI